MTSAANNIKDVKSGFLGPDITHRIVIKKKSNPIASSKKGLVALVQFSEGGFRKGSP